MTNVEFFTKAKTLERYYKQQRYTLTYLPPTKEWQWKVEWIQKQVFSEKEKTLAKAQKAAQKHIDETLKLRGKT